MLRQVREDIEKNYFDPAFKGIDMAAKFSTAEQLIAKATTLNEMYAVLTDAVTALDDSHTVFLPPSRAARVDYGWRMAMVGDAPLVVSVTEGSDAAAKGMAPGDRVVSLNRFTPDRTNLWQIFLLYNVVRPQAQQHVVLRKPDGRELVLDVASKVTNQRFVQLSDLVLEEERSEDALKQRTEAVGADILVWRMPSFADPKPVEDAIKKARAYKTLVIDLRRNGGGAVSTLSTMVSWFFDREVVIGTEKTRKKEVVERTKTRKDPFSGKVIALVDSETGSAAEMFARVLQIEKRGIVLGDRTAGAVMTGRLFGHVMGMDSLMFYGTMVTVGDVRMSDGSTLEKVGVSPDEIAWPAPSDLASRHDPVLARALKLAGATVTPEEAGRILK